MASAESFPKIRTDLAYYGVVTRVISATQFTAAGLAGLGDGALVGYAAYVLAKVNGTVTAPHREQPIVTAYISAAGTFSHIAYTASLTVGDQLLLLHPNVANMAHLSGLTPVTGALTANWQAAEQDLVTIGADNVRYKLHLLAVGIQNLIGNISIRLYMQVNGVERRIYPIPAATTWVAATDAPVISIVNGTMGIHEALRVTVQSDNGADNGQIVDYDYMLEAM